MFIFLHEFNTDAMSGFRLGKNQLELNYSQSDDVAECVVLVGAVALDGRVERRVVVQRRVVRRGPAAGVAADIPRRRRAQPQLAQDRVHCRRCQETKRKNQAPFGRTMKRRAIESLRTFNWIGLRLSLSRRPPRTAQKQQQEQPKLHPRLSLPPLPSASAALSLLPSETSGGNGQKHHSYGVLESTE
jgi:hypothetical protein